MSSNAPVVFTWSRLCCQWDRRAVCQYTANTEQFRSTKSRGNFRHYLKVLVIFSARTRVYEKGTFLRRLLKGRTRKVPFTAMKRYRYRKRLSFWQKAVKTFRLCWNFPRLFVDGYCSMLAVTPSPSCAFWWWVSGRIITSFMMIIHDIVRRSLIQIAIVYINQ